MKARIPAPRFAALAIAVALAGPVAGQEGPASDGSDRTPNVHPLRTERTLRDLPEGRTRTERVPLEPTTIPLMLEEALLSALGQNLEIRVESHNPALRETDVETARSRFDPVGFWNISRQRSIQQGGSQLAGAANLEQVVDEMRTGLRKTGLAGTTYEISVGGRRTASNSSFALNRVQYTTDLTLTVTQPLLRSFGFDHQRAELDIARTALDQSYYAFQALALDVVNRTENAYWDLVLARENLEIQRDSLRLAEEALQISQIKFEVGTASRIDVLDFQSNVAEANRVLIQALNQLRDAEDQLKGLIRPQDMEYLFNATLVPTVNLPLEAEAVEAAPIDVFRAIDHALAYRPDLLRLRLAVERQGIEIRRAKNQLLPKLDVEGSFSMNGLERSFEESIDTSVTGDFYTWQIGLALEIPFGNRAASARYRQALIARRQAADEVERFERAAILEVRIAAREVESKVEEINAAKQAKFFAREKWEAERSRYEAGERTAFEVNEFRNEFIRARLNEVRAFTEYFKALADLEEAEGSALEELRRAGYRIEPAGDR